MQSGAVNFLTDDLAQSVNLVVDWGGTAVADVAKSLILLTPAADTSSRDGNFVSHLTLKIIKISLFCATFPDYFRAGATLQVIEFNDGVTVTGDLPQ